MNWKQKKKSEKKTPSKNQKRKIFNCLKRGRGIYYRVPVANKKIKV